MKNIIVATALSLMVGTAAFAQTTTFSTYQADVTSDVYASELIGMRIYAAEADYDMLTPETPVAAGSATEWDDIGEVNDVILGRDGQVRAVILGVGGFIGIGEKDVALPMSAIKMIREADAADADDFFLVVNANKDVLTNAEEFKSATDIQAERQMEETKADVNEQVEEVKTVVSDTADNTAAAVSDTANAVTTTTADGVTTTTTAATDAANATAETVTEAGEEVKEEVAEGTAAVTTAPVRMDGDRAMLRTPEFEREGYTTVEFEELTTETLTGARVYGLNDEDIGEIDTLVVDDSGKITKAVLGIGGFLGLGEHAVALTMDELKIMRTAEGDDFRVYVDASKEELEAQPQYAE